ncbi:MAG: hypothetical protein GHCLOJNM_01599 [bacterium]|nr:hypothetical protein [bacterium]
MARKKTTITKRQIESYEHKDKLRVNNPPVGLVTPDTDPDAGAKKIYAYDPHLDPQLQWAGKAEHTSFEVPTVSLHVHERIDPRTIIEAVRKRPSPQPSPSGRGWRGAPGEGVQLSLFEEERNEPLRDAIEFYRHAHGWSNRLVAGDSLLVMNSLLEKEGLAGKVQMIYLDPPYGIRYGSNFQPFVNKRDVKDGKDEDLTAEPEQIRAFRDTWELGIHSYLTYLRDRLLLARELLAESGSVFVQISDENVHHVRSLLQEVFGAGNYCGEIAFRKTSGTSSSLVGTVNDFLIWYAKDKAKVKFRQVFRAKTLGGEGTQEYTNVELPDGTIRKLSDEEQSDPARLPNGSRVFVADPVVSAGGGDPNDQVLKFQEGSRTYKIDCGPKRHWKTTRAGMEKLWNIGRLLRAESLRIYKRYFDDFPFLPFNSMWDDTRGETQMDYVVQTATKVIQRCLLMTTDPGDLVFDPTCGSGTTAYVAEQWGRRWITCDTSRVALTLAKQRLMTAVFDYYELAYPSPQPSPRGRGSDGNPLPMGEGGRRPGEGEQGVWNGFKYKTVPHVTLKSIANNPDIREGMTRAQIDAAIARHAPQETLYDQPLVDRKKTRVSGPFTVEAVPAPAVKSVEELLPSPSGRGAGGEGKKALEPEFREFVRQLRREQTDAEQLLWSLLRDRRFLGFKFRRQHPIEPYALDFYCHEARLAIELDGGQHNEPDARARDERRTAFLEAQGIRVLRFWNNEMLTNTEGVLEVMQEALSPTLSQRERGFLADASIARSGETLRQGEWRDELLRTGIRGKAGQHIRFARLEPLPGCRWLHTDGETKDEQSQRIVVSFGPEHAPLEQRQVEHAWEEARALVPKPQLLVFAAFQFDPEAAKDIDELKPEKVGMQLLKVQMNADLLTDDLKKKRASNESFWLIGQPDVRVERIEPSPRPSPSGRGGQGEGVKYRVSVHGFDYYNTKTGGIESGGEDKIAVWLLDTDYDGRSLYPRQVFFPMAGEKDGWARLAKNLKAEIDEERIEAYRGTASLPFEPGEHQRIAVKIVDDRGIESLKVMELE